MTEGAKTGTPRKLCLYCQYPVANQKEWDEIPGGEGDHLCWGECNERNDVDSLLRKSRSDLTEALKVAGDLAQAALALADLAERNTDDTDEWEAAIGRVRSLAALERIRNQSKP